jgi:regulator of protease activity HflC (stomatin/prohibitin superfamily)
LLAFLGCTASVATGNTGVVTTFGKVENYTLEAGFHLKAPWHTVTEMDNRVQKTTVELSCFSSDIQEVSMKYTLNYQIDKSNAQEIYRTVGKNYYATIIEPNIAEAVKVATAKYTAEQLVQTRSNLAKDIETLLETNLSNYNIKVSSTAIEDMDFTDAFTTAVENKQVAEQRKKQAEIEQAQALAQAENDRKIAETNAKANAEVAKIQAEADMEVAKIAADSAEYQGKKEAAIALQRLASINGWTVVHDEETGLNKLYKPDGSEVTDEELREGASRLIEYYYTQQWDGSLPETMLGDGSNTLIGIGSSTKQND